MYARLLALTLCLSAHWASTAHAFGHVGHRVTGYIADELLTPEAHRAIRALIGSTDLSVVATYLDEQREALEQRSPGSSRWHYENRQICAAVKPIPTVCPNGQCITQQLQRFLAILKDARAARAQRIEALRVVAHLVGDLHQPLHLADNRDRGGNDTYVLFGKDRKPQRLHEIWDTRLLKINMDRKHATTHAKNLLAEYAAQHAAWRQGSVDEWAVESFGLGRQAYARLPGFSCGEHEAVVVRLPDVYVQQSRRTVDEQLAKAGVRLAVVLNAAFSPTPSDNARR